MGPNGLKISARYLNALLVEMQIKSEISPHGWATLYRSYKMALSPGSPGRPTDSTYNAKIRSIDLFTNT